MSPQARRLLQAIREALPWIPEDAQFRRTHAGAHQRAAGAWSWLLVKPDGTPVDPNVGSQFPQSALRQGAEVSWDRHTSAWQVDPCIIK